MKSLYTQLITTTSSLYQFISVRWVVIILEMEENKVCSFEITVHKLLFLELQKLSAITGKSTDLLLNEAILLLCKQYEEKEKKKSNQKPLASR